MKIALFHELPYGGARRAVIEFGRQLKKDHEVDLYYIDESKEKNIEKAFNKIYYSKFTPKKWTGGNWKAKLYKDTFELYKLYKLHKKISKEIDGKKYDFVFVHGSKYTQAPFILSILRTKTAYYCQEPLRMVYEELFDIPKDLSFLKTIYERFNRNNRRLIDKRNVFSADVLLANSKFTKKNIKKAYGLDSITSYMGIDPKRFFPEKIDKKYDLLFIGSKDDIDGYKLLEDSISLMKNKPKVRWLLREEEWIDNDRDMRRIYSSAKILTCLAYKEPFGLMPIEAQACGTAVVAVKEGGYLDSVSEDVSGVFVNRDPRKIAETVTKLLKNETKIKLLSSNALENVRKNWTWEANTKMLLKNINVWES